MTSAFAGDADQLPPVGAGSFLAAAIQSGAVPVVDLREVFRQAQGSAIVKAAHAVHAGLMPPLQRINPESSSGELERMEALWVVPPSAADIEDEVVRTVSSGLLGRRGINVKTDLQVSILHRPFHLLHINCSFQLLHPHLWLVV